MTLLTLLVISLALNLASAAVHVVQRARYQRLAASSCETCPFVVGHEEAARRFPLPVTTDPTLQLIRQGD